MGILNTRLLSLFFTFLLVSQVSCRLLLHLQDLPDGVHVNGRPSLSRPPTTGRVLGPIRKPKVWVNIPRPVPPITDPKPGGNPSRPCC